MLTSIPEPWRYKVFVGAAADYFFTNARHLGGVGARPRRHPDRAHRRSSRRIGRPGRRAHRRRLEPVIFPEGGRRPTAGASPSGAAPPTSRSAAVCRSCRSTSTAPADPRARAAKRARAVARPGHLRCSAAAERRREHHAGTPSGSRRRSPRWPTRSTDRLVAARRARPTRHDARRSPAPTLAPGAAPGPSGDRPASVAARRRELARTLIASRRDCGRLLDQAQTAWARSTGFGVAAAPPTNSVQVRREHVLAEQHRLALASPT